MSQLDYIPTPEARAAIPNAPAWPRRSRPEREEAYCPLCSRETEVVWLGQAGSYRPVCTHCGNPLEAVDA